MRQREAKDQCQPGGACAVAQQRQKQDQRHKEAVQRVDLGDSGLRPPGAADGKGGAHGRRGQPAAAQLAGNQEHHADSGGAGDRREQIDTQRLVTHRQQAEQPAQDRVEGIASGVCDSQAGEDDLKLQAVVENGGHCRRQGGEVEQQCGRAHS